MTQGELTTSDCLQAFEAGTRLADVYSLPGRVGQAVTIDVTATGAAPRLVPYVAVVDADGQFGGIESRPPVQFVVTTSSPYQIAVTSDLSSAERLGAYRVTVTVTTCAAPAELVLNSSRAANLDGSECPDPGGPSIADQSNPADVYHFTLTQVPLNVSITMRQLASSGVDPAFSVLNPDGIEVITQEQDDDAAPGGSGVDAQARFLALQPGTYTIIAIGNGGTGSYSLALNTQTCSATALNNIPTGHVVTCPGQSGPGCMGTLFGDTRRTPCRAPFPDPSSEGSMPELNSPSELYTITALPGDVISAELMSDGDAHLYLVGPASAGNPLVAENDNSGVPSDTKNAQLAATAVLPGTYTLVVASNHRLDLPYTLLVQKCQVRGALNATTGTSISSGFTTTDCYGFGGIPYRTYAFIGSAGQFVTVEMNSDTIDPFLRVFAPDGSVVENDDDIFEPSTTNARANRLLPGDGLYYAEVSTAPAQGAIDATASPGFTLRARVCPSRLVVSGSISGSFDEADCELPSGRKLDVYTFAPAAPQVLSVAPPSNGCVVGFLAEGRQLPDEGCSSQPLDMPLVSVAPYGFAIAGRDTTTRGAYTAGMSKCPLSVLGYGDERTATLSQNSCQTPANAPADWYLLRAPADVVRFNDGISGQFTAAFAAVGRLSDLLGALPVADTFYDGPDSMFRVSSDLAALLRITGASAVSEGSYTVRVAPAFFRR